MSPPLFTFMIDLYFLVRQNGSGKYVPPLKGSYLEMTKLNCEMSIIIKFDPLLVYSSTCEMIFSRIIKSTGSSTV